MITTILFDLDGTLLPMDQDVFVRSYFGELTKKMLPREYEPKKLIETIWNGTNVMVQNNGACSNEDAFWNYFGQVYGENGLKDKTVFDEFYRVEFQKAAAFCGFNAEAKKTVDAFKKAGYRIVLATNPLFPSVATQSRIRWAGLEPSDFEFYTTYENSCYCKPNTAYYTELLQKIGCQPEECLMVGNDVTEDMAAQKLGMSVFLLTDCLINKEETDISVYPHGGFEALQKYVL